MRSVTTQAVLIGYPTLDGSERLKNAYAVGITAVMPLIVFWLVRDPVAILSVGGIIAAIHTPGMVFLTQYLNKTRLPRETQPGWLMSALMSASGLLFLAFAVLCLLDLVGVRSIQATQTVSLTTSSTVVSLSAHTLTFKASQ